MKNKKQYRNEGFDEAFEYARQLELSSAGELPALDCLFIGCMVDVAFTDKEGKEIAA